MAIRERAEQEEQSYLGHGIHRDSNGANQMNGSYQEMGSGDRGGRGGRGGRVGRIGRQGRVEIAQAH